MKLRELHLFLGNQGLSNVPFSPLEDEEIFA